MNKIMNNLSEAMKELNVIEQMEREFGFVKKQALAYKIEDMMNKGGFVEIMYLGHVTDYTGINLNNGHYFDIKTPEEDYTQVDLWSSTSWNVEFENYESRLDGVISEFKYLKPLCELINDFLEKNPSFSCDLIGNFSKNPISNEIDSIMRCVMSEHEYVEWHTLKERNSIESITPLPSREIIASSHRIKKI